MESHPFFGVRSRDSWCYGPPQLRRVGSGIGESWKRRNVSWRGGTKGQGGEQLAIRHAAERGRQVLRVTSETGGGGRSRTDPGLAA